MIHTDGKPTIASQHGDPLAGVASKRADLFEVVAEATYDAERDALQVEPLVPSHGRVKPLDVLANGATVIAVGPKRSDTTLVLALFHDEYVSWWLDRSGHCYHGAYERNYEAAFADFTARANGW